MWRLIFILLLATTVPHLLEAVKCHNGSEFSQANFTIVNCHDSFACHQFDCSDHGMADYKGCGRCPVPNDVNGCKCSECFKDLCNDDKLTVEIKQCYGGQDAKYEPVNCMDFNNNACRTFKCDGEDFSTEGYKSCGKCPAPGDLWAPVDMNYCNCTECIGELCNGGIGNGPPLLSLWAMIGGVIVLMLPAIW